MARGPGVKIAMVGGGSYNWCPHLLSDLMQTESLNGTEIALLDPNLRAAEEVAAAAATIARTFGRQYKIVPTASEAVAFRGADFVIITISTGGLKAMAHDLKVPEKYGIYHTVGDTVGPGGWSRALRNVPVFVHLARQIEKYAPRAVVLNYTNPLAVLTATLCQTAGLRAVGLCHGVFGTYQYLQQVLGVEEKDLNVRFGGVNHFYWVLDFTVKGQPGYPLLARTLGKRTLDEALRGTLTDPAGYHNHWVLADELYRQYGYLTYADRHSSEFLPNCIAPTPAALKRWGLVRTSVSDRAAGLKRGRQATLDLAAGRRPPAPRSRETAVDIIEAVACGKPFCDVVNVPNVGQVDNLPRGAVVETLGLVDALGFRPVTSGPLPAVLKHMVEPHCQVQLMTVRAALAGDRELALQALMCDPVCSHLSPAEVRRLGLELMAATRAWLPQFAGPR